ncbi:hypothetical protein [Jiangella muralis]|uniref:hypothetical protein n=1 Tax=Jiangella muralis TaxID=702383 RepID=UPI00069F4213|nr:hypothetical protein [Jiangella muralis]
MTEPDETPRGSGHPDGPPPEHHPSPPSTPPPSQAAPDPAAQPSEAVTGPFDVVPDAAPATETPAATAPSPEAPPPGYHPQHAPGQVAPGQPAPYPPPGYPPQGYAPPPGYPPGQPYPPPGQAGYAPQPGYAPPPGYAPQPGYPPQPQQGYPPQPGYYAPPGQQPYGYAPYPPAQHRPATPMPIYLTAALFLACGLFTLIIALTNWFGSPGPGMTAALVGVAFSGDITGNIDFAVSASMTVACTTLTVAVVLLFKLAFARWILVGLGGLVIIAYFVGIIDLASNGGGRYIALPIVAMVLWIGSVVVALLPVTNRAFALSRQTPGPY